MTPFLVKYKKEFKTQQERAVHLREMTIRPNEKNPCIKGNTQ